MTTAATSLNLRALFSRAATRLSLNKLPAVTAGLSPAAKALAAVSLSRAEKGVTLLVVPTDKDVEQVTADARFFYAAFESASACRYRSKLRIGPKVASANWPPEWPTFSFDEKIFSDLA